MEYRTARNVYWEMCKRKQKEHYDKIARQLDSVRGTGEWWALVNEMKVRKCVVRSEICMNDYVDYFRSLLVKRSLGTVFSYADLLIEDDILDDGMNMREIVSSLNGLKNEKAPAEDGIPSEFYKYHTEGFLQIICDVFNRMYEGMSVDESFNSVLLCPVYKKGDRSDVNNYRGISFGNTIGKLFASVMNERLKKWVDANDRLNEFQAGFRKGYSTIDNVFSLIGMVNIKWNEGCKRVYCFFVDFKAAFDRVNRSALFYKLSMCGISSKFLNVIKSMYDRTSARIYIDGKASEPFDTDVGVRQGCVLSPLLFALFLNDLHGSLTEAVNIKGKIIRVLMYADDIVIAAESAGQLQIMMKELELYCRTWDLEVNLDKSEVMIMKKGGGRMKMTRDGYLMVGL